MGREVGFDVTIGEETRNKVYWALDRLRGGPVRRHAQDIARCWSDPQYCAEQAQRRLEVLLRHAVGSVPFYKGLRPTASLDAFPVISKVHVALSRAALRSELALRCARAVRTSGSYGTPMVFYHNREKRRRRAAEVLKCNELAGYRLGMRHMLIRTRPKPLAVRLLQNELVVDAAVMDERWLHSTRRRLSAGRVRILIGHPSALGALAQHCADQGDAPDRLGVEGVISYAEPLLAAQRETITKAFGCPVLDRYASEEFGILAHEVPGCSGLHVNGASYIVETLAVDADRPADPGELGRVVVTDLWSEAMPLIRYETGDLAVVERAAGGALGGAVLARLEGRAVETVYATSGTPVSPLAIVDALSDVLSGDTHVLQFQFAQVGERHYRVRVRYAADSIPEGLAKSVRRTLCASLGREAAIAVDHVDQLRALPSGKRPPVVNEWTDNE